jgi:hypothetical protein
MEQYFKDFAESGGLAATSLTLFIGLVLIIAGHLYALKHPDKELRVFLETGDKRLSYTKINIICFITIFIFDWMYAWAFRFFGKKRFIYPTLLSLIGGLIGVFSSGDMSGDAAEFVLFGLVPIFLVVHCLGWLHVNIVYYRVRKGMRND